MDNLKKEEQYLEEISKKRDEMIWRGMQYGLMAPETIGSSRELDQLLNEYSRAYKNHLIKKPACHMPMNSMCI